MGARLSVRQLIGRYSHIISICGIGSLEEKRFYRRHQSRSEFPGFAEIVRNIWNEAKKLKPTIVRYTEIMQATGGPESDSAKNFYAAHMHDPVFVRRANTLARIWPSREETKLARQAEQAGKKKRPTKKK